MLLGPFPPEKLASLNAERSRLAVRYGLPPIGAKMVNQFGLEWVVDGHAYIPDLTSLARHKGQFVRHDPSDLMPIVVPQNLSPRMLEFLNELDRCTSRIQMVFDTMPHLRPHQAHRDGYSVDMFSDPHALVFCLDVAHLHETILAHEVAHVWIDLVEDCEDYRLMRDLSDTTKVRQVLYIQSFVLDRKVNRVIARKGFDLGIIASQQWDTINWMAQRVAKADRPTTKREGVFAALSIAATLYEQGQQDTTPSNSSGFVLPSASELAAALEMLRSGIPRIYALAEDCAAAVRRHGIHSREQLRASIDECLRLTFEYTGEGFDFEAELEEVPPPEDEFDLDKFPEFFPGWPPKAKNEVGRLMAKHDIAPGTQLRLQRLPSGQFAVAFWHQGAWTVPTVLQHAPDMLPAGGQPLAPPQIPLRLPPRAKGDPKIPMTRPVSVVPSLQVAHPMIPQPLAPVAPVGPTVPPPHNVLHDAGPIHHGRRNYMPGVGRWLNRDPLGHDADDYNLYRYVANNPVTYQDPQGMKKAGQAGKNCSPAQLAIIRPAVKDFCDLFKSKGNRGCVWSCLDKYNVTNRFSSFQKWCQNPKYDCWTCKDPTGHPDPNACAQTGETNGPSYTIHFCQNLTKPGCKSLTVGGGTIGHESSHGAGVPGESGYQPGGGFHPTIYAIGFCIAACIQQSKKPKPCPQPPTRQGVIPENGGGTVLPDYVI